MKKSTISLGPIQRFAGGLPGISRRLCALATLVACSSSIAVAQQVPAMAVPAPTTSSCSVPGAGAIGGSFIDPYSIYGASSARLDTLFANMKRSGMDTAIVQWTGFRYSDGRIVVTYDGGPASEFKPWDDSLPRIVASAKKAGVKLWIGLLVSPDVFDKADTNQDTALFDQLADASVRLATELQARFGADIAGWYIPVEPGLQSVNDPVRTAQHVAFFARVTAGLRQLPRLPVLGSPAVARAIEANMTGVQFVQRFEPFFAGSGVDVWALQDGFEMTAWTPSANAELIRTGQTLAAAYGVKVWADIYTPGPGESNFPTSVDGLRSDLDALAATGVPIVSFTFDSAMNGDSSRANAAERQTLVNSYIEYCRPVAPR